MFLLAADKAFAAGVPEMIIVMPNAYTKFAGSMYSNSVTTGDWEGFIAQDLVAYLDGTIERFPNVKAAVSRDTPWEAMARCA